MIPLILLLTFAAASIAVLYAYKQGYNHGVSQGQRLGRHMMSSYTQRLREQSQDQMGADRP